MSTWNPLYFPGVTSAPPDILYTPKGQTSLYEFLSDAQLIDSITGNPTLDYTAELQALIDYARINQLAIIPYPCTIKVSATIIVDAYCDFTDMVVWADATQVSPVLRVGSAIVDGGAVPNNLRVVTPKLINTAKVAANWTGFETAIGVELANLYTCHVTVGRVSGFGINLQVGGYLSSGCSYNYVEADELHNGMKQVRLRPNSNTSWSNQNTFVLKRLQVDSTHGIAVAGTRQVLIEDLGIGANGAANNNTFFGCSFEGNVAEYHIENQGTDNLFLNCRYEATGGARILHNGPYAGRYAQRNGYVGGYGIDEVVWSGSGNYRYNFFSSSLKQQSDATYLIRNTVSSNNTAIGIVESTVDPLTADPQLDCTLGIGAYKLIGKRKADAIATPRFLLDTQNGDLLGRSNLAPITLTLSAASHNVAPTGFNYSTLLRLNVTADCDLTGLAPFSGVRDGMQVTIVNAGTNVVTLRHDSASSNAGNRFYLGGIDIALQPNQTLTLWRDNTLARWVLGASAPTGNIKIAAVSISSAIAANQMGQHIRATSGAGTITLILPITGISAGDTLRISKIDSAVGRVIAHDGTNSLAWLSTQWDYAMFQWSGSAWQVVDWKIAPIIDMYTANGTWTKPPLAAMVEVQAAGQGGGGGSGRRGAAGTVRCGGGGGGHGAFISYRMRASIITNSTVSVSVGTAGGQGGTAITVDDTSGNTGTAGSNSNFGGNTDAWFVTARGGNGGVGGTAAAGVGGNGVPGNLLGANVAGASASATGGAGANGTTAASGGSASGAGLTAANAESAGGNASIPWFSLTGTAVNGGTAPGGAGANGRLNQSSPEMWFSSCGGAGGASAAAAAGGAGGNGGGYGTGGGGGGASANGNASGKGGDGAPGIMLVITYFQ